MMKYEAFCILLVGRPRANQNSLRTGQEMVPGSKTIPKPMARQDVVGIPQHHNGLWKRWTVIASVRLKSAAVPSQFLRCIPGRSQVLALIKRQFDPRNDANLVKRHVPLDRSGDRLLRIHVVPALWYPHHVGRWDRGWYSSESLEATVSGLRAWIVAVS
jgi:hypothetical protein